MRKVLLALSAVVLCAAPLRAQQDVAAPTSPAPVAASAAVADRSPESAPAPSLFPSSDEVRDQVRRSENGRVDSRRATTTHDWLYLVAAIAVGIIIAAVVLD
jgi:hypothetical protein